METDRQTRDTLWTLIAAPTVWAFHFLFAYVLAAFECAPNAQIFEPIGGTRVAVGMVTLVSLVLIGLVLRRSWREWRHHGGGFQHDQDTDLSRERFLEFSTLLLASLSFVAVLFDTLPVLLIGDCR